MSFSGRVGTIRSRRKPGAPPAISAQAKTALAACEALPPEIREQMRAVIVPLTQMAIGQDTFNKRARSAYDSFPAPHRDTHLPDSQIDPLLIGPVAALGAAASDGTANKFARSDHVHQRAVETANGYVRRRFNFGAGFVVTDDAGNDEIDVAMSRVLPWVAIAMGSPDGYLDA